MTLEATLTLEIFGRTDDPADLYRLTTDLPDDWTPDASIGTSSGGDWDADVRLRRTGDWPEAAVLPPAVRELTPGDDDRRTHIVDDELLFHPEAYADDEDEDDEEDEREGRANDETCGDACGGVEADADEPSLFDENGSLVFPDPDAEADGGAIGVPASTFVDGVPAHELEAAMAAADISAKAIIEANPDYLPSVGWDGRCVVTVDPPAANLGKLIDLRREVGEALYDAHPAMITSDEVADAIEDGHPDVSRERLESRVSAALSEMARLYGLAVRQRPGRMFRYQLSTGAYRELDATTTDWGTDR